MVPQKSIWSRKSDLIYLVFFVIHIPVMLIVDLPRYYPASLRPQFTVTISDWYISTYHDRLFENPPPWMHAFFFLEAVYHLPLSIWAIGALLNDDPRIPLHLLVFAVETAVTTLACCAEAAGWEGYTMQETIALEQALVPYLALACLMGVDMFLRIERKIVSDVKRKGE